MPLSTDSSNAMRRHLLLATACALLILGTFAGVAHAEWGELGNFHLAAGTGEKQVNFASSASVLAFATDSADSSYYIGDEPKEGEYRIQRFVGGNEEASISFTPPEPKKSHGVEGETAVGLQLEVDPTRNRVYALVLYKRRSEGPGEEKELENEEKALEKEGKQCEPPKLSCWERFPLDSEEQAAGELYAFELSAGNLVSLKEEEGKPVPLIGETTASSSTTAFADQSETPKEALLHPRGMAVDPAGNLAIVGVEDEEPDAAVEKEESEKQCRAVAQFVLFETKSGKVTGKLGHRYVDRADALRPGEGGCQPEEITEVPLSPVVTPTGNLLIYSGAQSDGQIWEVPTPGSDTGTGELETTPTVIFDEHQVGGLLDMEPPAEGGGPVMSFVPTGSTEGTIYLSIEGFKHEPLPLALKYVESADKASEVSEIGWTAGGAGEMCGIPAPANVAAVMGAGKESVLVLDAYLEEGTHSPRVETFAFGPGGSTSGCPKPELTAPKLVYGLDREATQAPVNQPVSLTSELKGAEAEGVQWTLKYKNSKTGEEGEEKIEQASAQLRNGHGEYEFVPLQFEFKHAGEYEITEVATSDDLAYESVPAVEVLKGITVTVAPPIVQPVPPKAVRNGEEATLSATVKDENESEQPTLHLKRVKWEFSDGGAAVEEKALELPNPSKVEVKHKFLARCASTKDKCKITLTVEDTAAAGTPAVSTFEITVNESVAEEEARHTREAEEERKQKEAEAAKAAEEAAQHKAEEEAAAGRKAAEEAAARKAAEEAAAHKKAEEEAIAKKHKEEEAAKKTPTRAQLLAKALKQCKKGPKGKRAKCEATARKKYGPKGKKKRRKK